MTRTGASVFWLTLAASTLLPAGGLAWRQIMQVDQPAVGLLLVAYGLMGLALLSLGWHWLSGRLEQSGAAAPALLVGRIRRGVACAALAMTCYGCGLAGLYLALASPDQLLTAADSPVGLLVLASVAGALLLAVPVVVALLIRLGVMMGPMLEGYEAVPVATRHLPLAGLLLAGLLAFPVFVYLATGGLPRTAVLGWLLLLTYGAGLLLLSLYYSRVALEPLQRFMGESKEPDSWRDELLVPTALDSAGTLIFQLRQLVDEVRALSRRHEESEARLRMFAEASSDWFFETDDQLRFTWISPVLESQAGVETDDVVGRSALELNRSNYLSRKAADRHLEDLQAHRPYRRFRTEVATHDGRQIHIEVSGLPCFDDQGRFLGYRGTGSNITEFVQAEARLRLRDAELAQAQKMEAIGQLTGGIAHDFNNLLTVVLGNLELLRMSDAVDTEAAALVEEAADAAGRGADLIRRLLAFARRQPLEPRPVDLAALLDDMERILQRTLGETIKLRCELPADLWEVLADAGQLQHAVLNLALNARNAMPEGGTLQITAVNRTLGRPHQLLAPGDYVRVSVRDNGCGISADHLPRVFEPFFSTRQGAGGSGLGLAMVHDFISQSGGMVTIDSEPGAGTEVDLWLPRVEAPAAAGAEPAATA